MHTGIKGEIYLGACPSAMELKEKLKDFLMEEDFLVIDLGAFDIEEQANCEVLAREVGEKVVEGVIYNQKDYEAQGLKVFGILIDIDVPRLSVELDKLSDIKASEFADGAFVDSEANMLTLSAETDFEEVSLALKQFYAK